MSPDEAIVLTLPGGEQRSARRGTSAREVLASGRPPTAAEPLGALFNGRAIDLSEPLNESGSLAPLTFADPMGRDILQHSSAHLVAKALTEVIPEALPTAGPPTEEGFYYDFDVRPLTPEDLDRVAEAMGRSVKAHEPFERFEVPKPEALKLTASNPHKQAFIAEVPEGEPISFYRTGTFVDLCRGPHVPHTGWLQGARVLGFSAITSGGSPSGEARQRVRGVGFPTRSELEAYLKLRKEAEARDHRILGPKLGLFMFTEDAPGFPFWLPNGMIVVRELERFVTESFAEAGYLEIRTPLLYVQSVFETSGHWDHYRENMFLSEVDGRMYGIKPMNCPGAMLIFRERSRSYRELPMRLAEFAPLHRLEASGTIHGLTRAREFVQDDAHLFVAEDQIEGELVKLLDWVQRAFSTFQLSSNCELSTRPTSFLGDPAQWDRAEATLLRVLERSGLPFKVAPGEGAFYGPKIDLHVRDSLGRPWQTGTIQLDYQIPLRFQLEYQGADGRMHTPIVIHRTILGSWERFFGVLLEHCAGKLPPWLAPIQVRVLPVSERHEPASAELVRLLRASRIRADSAGSSETLSKRVREGELDRVPYLVVLGDAEASSGAVARRIRGQKGQRTVPQADLIRDVTERIRTRSFDP